MNRFFKAGLLIVTLVIPALIFTFLRFFATNHYNLPYYHPVTDSLGHVLMNGQDTVFYKVKAPVLLIEGKSSSFEGRVTVVNYLPKSCDDSCQLVLSQLERVYDLRGGIRDLHLLSITEKWPVDFPHSFSSMGKEGWSVGMTARENMNAILNRDFKFQTKVPGAKTNFADTKLLLIDRYGYIRGYYAGTNKAETDRLMAEIKILEYERNNQK